MFTKLFLSVLIFTASTFFALGVFFQHEDVRRRLLRLIASDPYAFNMRHKLYELLAIFKYNGEMQLARSDDQRLLDIMKYGFPSLDDVRLCTNFVLSYDRHNEAAHWVCEHLQASKCLTASHSAPRPQRTHPDLSAPWNYRYTEPNNYGAENNDLGLGHMAALAFRMCQQSHCNATFFGANIAPHLSKGFNRNAWQRLEMYIRELVERYGSVYVCSGPLYIPQLCTSTGRWYLEYASTDTKTVAVPTHFFKVIIIESKMAGGRPYMEAYVMPNAPLASDDVSIRSFLRDIRAIEQAAGLKFFQGLRRSFLFGNNYPTSSELFHNFE